MDAIKFIPKKCIPLPAVPMVPATETEDAIPSKPAYEPEYTGYVMLRMPDFDTIQSIQEAIEVHTKPGETADEIRDRLINDPMTRVKAQHSYDKYVRAVVLPSHVEQISLIRVEDGVEINSWDKLTHETPAFGIIREIIAKFLGKNRLGISDPS